MGSSPLHTANVKRPMEALSAFLRPLVARQEEVSVTMGVHLQSLVDHYEQISGALRDYGQRNDEVNNINETVLQYERSGAVHPPSALLEGGFGLSDEDLESLSSELSTHASTNPPSVFRKDTEELPAIISDIEMSAEEIDLIGYTLPQRDLPFCSNILYLCTQSTTASYSLCVKRVAWKVSLYPSNARRPWYKNERHVRRAAAHRGLYYSSIFWLFFLLT